MASEASDTQHTRKLLKFFFYSSSPSPCLSSAAFCLCFALFFSLSVSLRMCVHKRCRQRQCVCLSLCKCLHGFRKGKPKQVQWEQLQVARISYGLICSSNHHLRLRIHSRHGKINWPLTRDFGHLLTLRRRLAKDCRENLRKYVEFAIGKPKNL